MKKRCQCSRMGPLGTRGYRFFFYIVYSIVHVIVLENSVFYVCMRVVINRAAHGIGTARPWTFCPWTIRPSKHLVAGQLTPCQLALRHSPRGTDNCFQDISQLGE
jgi:hypothetical protein